MKYLLLFSILLYAKTATCQQFALINDLDGFVYVRKSAEKSNNITDTLKSGQIVLCFETTGNWINIAYHKNGGELLGYVYNNRVKYISSYDTIPTTSHTQNTAVLQKDSIKVVLITAAFESAKNKLGYKTTNGYKFLNTINGKPFFGTDGGVPKRRYQSIQVSTGNKSFTLSNSDIEDLFEPGLPFTSCFADRKNNIIYLTANNSDGAGAYSVIWVIQNGKCINRLAIAVD